MKKATFEATRLSKGIGIYNLGLGFLLILGIGLTSYVLSYAFSGGGSFDQELFFRALLWSLPGGMLLVSGLGILMKKRLWIYLNFIFTLFLFISFLFLPGHPSLSPLRFLISFVPLLFIPVCFLLFISLFLSILLWRKTS